MVGPSDSPRAGDSRPLPLLRPEIVSLLCLCGASGAWTMVQQSCAPLAPHNRVDSLQMKDMMLHVTSINRDALKGRLYYSWIHLKLQTNSL